MSALRVLLIQQPLIWQDPAANRAHFGALLAPLAGQTDLVVLPETFTTGFSMEVERLAEAAGGPTVEWLRRHGRTGGCAAGRVSAEIPGTPGCGPVYSGSLMRCLRRL